MLEAVGSRVRFRIEDAVLNLQVATIVAFTVVVWLSAGFAPALIVSAAAHRTARSFLWLHFMAPIVESHDVHDVMGS